MKRKLSRRNLETMSPRDDAACTTMRRRSRSQDPHEGGPARSRRARHADAGHGRPPGVLVLPHDRLLVTASRLRAEALRNLQPAAADRGAVPDRMLRFKSRARDGTSEAIHQ